MMYGLVITSMFTLLGSMAASSRCGHTFWLRDTPLCLSDLNQAWMLGIGRLALDTVDL